MEYSKMILGREATTEEVTALEHAQAVLTQFKLRILGVTDDEALKPILPDVLDGPDPNNG